MCTLDGINAEHIFRVWVTILGRMSRHFHFHFHFSLSKKLARGQQRAEKARHFEKIQLGEHLATNEVN